MKTADLQQCLSGFKTVAIIGGPMIVRVHEALDVLAQTSKHRYLISVDFKFRQFDALHVGELGWLGMTKTEATRDANHLAQRINTASSVLDSAREHVKREDTLTTRITLRRQEERFNGIISKYTAEFV